MDGGTADARKPASGRQTRSGRSPRRRNPCPCPMNWPMSSAAELARRVRTRDLSPVEIVDAFLERVAARNPSITAFVHVAAEDARNEAVRAEREVMSGAALGPLHGIRTAIKDLNGLKPGWPCTYGGIRRVQGPRGGWLVSLRGAHGTSRRDPPRPDQQPRLRVSRGVRQLSLRAIAQPLRRPAQHRGLVGGSASAVADGLLPLAQGTDGGGDPSGFRLPGPASTATRHRPVACRTSPGPTPSAARARSCSTERSPARWRIRPSPCPCSPATTREIPSVWTKRSTGSAPPGARFGA